MQKSIPALTPTDLFTPPGLRPSLPSQYKFSPCGRYVSYLRGSETAPSTLDLWCFDRQQAIHTPIATALQLDAQANENVTELSDAERAEPVLQHAFKCIEAKCTKRCCMAAQLARFLRNNQCSFVADRIAPDATLNAL